MSTTRVEQYATGVLTTANQLTILRIVFVPVFIILLVYGQTGWALATYTAAGITDALDGIIARRFGQKTKIGTYLDPIADKLLMTSTVVILSLPQMDFANLIPRWLLVIMISRDVFIFILTIVLLALYGFQVFPPSVYGKVSTILQGGTMLVVLFCNWRGVVVPQLLVLYVLTGLITAVSGLHYLITKALK